MRQEKQQQPMLLNAELIDKLMSNKTLVGLMSSQLKRVIDTDMMSDEEKQRIVRQVFDQMMEEKVDFSMNNVRLAVKTVSSSYRAAAEKQRKRSSSAGQTNFAYGTKGRLVNKLDTIDPKGFGRRANSAESRRRESQVRDGRATATTIATITSTSRSFPVIDTALKLTKGAQTTGSSRTDTDSMSAKGDGTNQRKVGESRDASGNPIVVVLLPQEKA